MTAKLGSIFKIKKWRKIIAIFVFILIFSLTISSACNSKIPDRNTTNKLLIDESVIYLEAISPYDYGVKVGKQFKLQYRLFFFLTNLLKQNKISEEDIENEINSMKEICPFFLEELKGLSDSLNIKLEKIITIIKSINSIFNNRCTTTLSTGPATKNNETFLTMNMDSSNLFTIINLRLYSYKFRIARINTIRYRYAFLGLPIIYEIPLINEKGLGFGGNGLSLTKNESRYIDEGPGISTFMLERLTMMTCKNVSEVADLWKNMERASGEDRTWPHFWDNSISVWCDREGGILMIEQTHNHILTVFGNSTEITDAPEGILWHANIHQWLNPNLTGSMTPEEGVDSVPRAKRARKLLEYNHGNITIDVVKSIMRDHGGGSDINGKDSRDICRHIDKNSSVCTAISWIIQPKKMNVYLTHGSPCTSLFWKHDFSNFFKN